MNKMGTIREFLLSETQDLTSGIRRAITSNKKTAALLSKVAQGNDGLLSETIAPYVPDLLNIRFIDILANAWNRYKTFKTSMEDGSGADKPRLVTLIDHSIKSVHKPCLEFLINNKKIAAF